MTQEEFEALAVGDIVQGRASGNGYVVVDHFINSGGHTVVATQTVTMTRPDEWNLIRKAGRSLRQFEDFLDRQDRMWQSLADECRDNPDKEIEYSMAAARIGMIERVRAFLSGTGDPAHD